MSYFIYDSDGGGWKGNNQTFLSSPEKPVFLQSAGLTEDIPIYQRVGECKNCKNSDIKWEIVKNNGEIVSLGPDNNNIWFHKPGTFSLGDPNDPPELTGDVNITAKVIDGVDPQVFMPSNSLTAADINPPCGDTDNLGTITDIGEL